MKFTIAAALAVVTALIEFTVVPYLKVGDAVPHPVLVFGVITAIIGGLETGLTWAFVGGPGPRHRHPATARLNVVLAAHRRRRRVPRRQLPRPNSDPGADRRHCSREPALLDADPSHDHRPDHRAPVVCRGRIDPAVDRVRHRPRRGRGAARGRHRGPPARRRAGCLVNDGAAYPAPRARPPPDPIPDVRHRDGADLRRPRHPARLPPDRSRPGLRRARRGEPHDGGSHPARHVA